MKVVIQRGETLEIELADPDDGSFTICYGKACLSIEAEFGDSRGRGDIIYAQYFGMLDLDDRQRIQEIIDPLYMAGELNPEELREAYRDLPDGWPLVHDYNDPAATVKEDRFLRVLNEMVADFDQFDYAWMKDIAELIASKEQEIPF